MRPGGAGVVLDFVRKDLASLRYPRLYLVTISRVFMKDTSGIS